MIENVDKETLAVNKLIGQKKKTIYVEGDIIVPDVKPDVLNIINSNGNSYIYKCEILDNRVKVDGCVNLYLIYLSANGGNRSLNTVLDFSDYIEFENLKQDANLEEKVIIKSIESKVLNERKINLKVMLEIEIKAYCNENIDFINRFDGIDGIKILNENIDIMALKGSGKSRASAKENIAVDVIDEIAEIFKVDVSIINKETKASYNKILAKSDVAVKIVYLTEDDRISVIEKNIPLMGFVDLQNVSEEDICISKYYLRNMVVTPNAKDEHSIYFDIDFEVQCDIYENKNINLVKDLYGINNDISFVTKNVRVSKLNDSYKKNFEVRENISINELNTICTTSYNVYIFNKKIYDNRINVDGEIEIEFLYESTINNNLTNRIVKIPFNQSIEWSNENTDITINIVSDNYIINPTGNIECIFKCECCLENEDEISIDLIDDVTIEEMKNEQSYSVVIYFVKPKDTLWNIAKQFKSTVDDIKYMNNLEDNFNVKPGDRLYITRCK